MKLKTRKVTLKKTPNQTRESGNAKFRALSDKYKPEFKPVRVHVKDTITQKGGLTKTFLEIKVQRFDDDEGLPFVFISTYQEAEKDTGYTGYLRGKTVHFPLEMMTDVLDALMAVSDTADRLKIS